MELLENYKPDKTGEFHSRKNRFQRFLREFLQQEIETFITPLAFALTRILRLGKNSTYVTYARRKLYIKWNRTWIIKSSETKREEISARYLYFRRGKEKSARSNERSPFESFQIVEWELGTRYAHRTGALDAFSRFEVGSNRRDQRKIRERDGKKKKN